MTFEICHEGKEKNRLCRMGNASGLLSTVFVFFFSLFLMQLLFSQDQCAGNTSEGEGSVLSLGPWMTNVRQDGITLLWETFGATPGTLEYGRNADFGQEAGKPETTRVEWKDGLGVRFIHKVRLASLEPNTHYNFRLRLPGGTLSGIGGFTTAPTGNADFRFGVWGDSQVWWGAEMHRFLTERAKVDFIVSAGDLSNSGGVADKHMRRQFVDRSIALDATRVPFYVAMGNHDVAPQWGGGDLIRSFFDQPQERNSDPDGRRGNFVFFYGGAAFITIDWNQTPNSEHDAPGSPTLRATCLWLESQLQSQAVADAPYVFLFIHRAPFYERWFTAEDPLEQELLPPLLEKYAVNACFSGHMHAYERGMRASQAKPGTYYCTVGTAGYLDTKENVRTDGKWEHITQGAGEINPAGFDGGLINGMVSVEVRQDSAVARFHAFDYSSDGKFGGYRGVMDEFVMTPRQLTNPSPLLR